MTCPTCQLNTAGQHEWNCPNNPNKFTGLPMNKVSDKEVKNTHDLVLNPFAPTYCRRCNKGGMELSRKECEYRNMTQPNNEKWEDELPKEAEELAMLFHRLYEELAPHFDYQTREESAKPWKNVPERNKQLMIAVCLKILQNYFRPELQKSRQAEREKILEMTCDSCKESIRLKDESEN